MVTRADALNVPRHIHIITDAAELLKPDISSDRPHVVVCRAKGADRACDPVHLNSGKHRAQDADSHAKLTTNIDMDDKGRAVDCPPRLVATEGKCLRIVLVVARGVGSLIAWW